MELNNEFEIKGIIPIIGIISSGKSTFLGALLGTDLLEVGVSTTTEFILFIKHNNNNDYLFQKIKPLGNGNNKGLFIKEGEVISGIDEIKDKIKELNEEFNNKKDVGINDLLYMLEMPISTIKNDFIKNNYCFLDLPGLNEANLLDKYSDIFERLKKLLKFEIFIFDSTQIEQDNAEKILINLNKKKWLVKENNLFILNKIDQCKKEKKQILDIFSFYFYNNFGDGAKKKNINNGLYIDIYSKNIFIPLNSLLFKSENVLNTRFDFSSLLEKELFTFIEENQFNNSFLYYLNEKLKVQKENYNELENLNLINDENNIDEDEEEDIFKGICNLKELIDKIKPPGFKEIDWDNINEGSDNFKLFKNIFLLYKKEKWRINYSNEFKEIEKYFINFEKEENEKGNIENQIYEDLKDIDALNSSLTSSLKQINMSHNSLRDSFIKLIKTEREKNRIMKEEENNEDNEKKIKILKQLNNFISNYLNEYINENMKIKPEDRKDNFKVFTNNINEIKEKLKVKKIRVSFIGNVSVGKSSILNCIIGDDILPIGITQCTYRGIIIKYKDEEEFKLYKTKLHEESSIYYYYFIDDKTPVSKEKI